MLHAGRDASRHLDPGGAIYCADHRLPGAGHLDVQQAGFWLDPAVRLWRRGRAHRRIGGHAPGGQLAAAAIGERLEGLDGAAFDRRRGRLGGVEVRDPGVVHDAWHGLTPAYLDTLLHHPIGGAARGSVAWSLLFIFLLYFTAPALATFTKLQVLDPNLSTSIIGKAIADVSNLDWVRNWSHVGFVKLVDFNGDGILQINEFFMRGDIVVLATPEIAGLPYVISGLVAAGGIAAAMSTADGLLLAIANALSHDLYYKILDPKADTRHRLIVARALLLVLGAAAAAVASLQLTNILGAVAWAFDFAMSGLFFPLVLGIWWKRGNRQGAIAGMIVGFLTGSLYLYLVRFAGMEPWPGIDHLRFGVIGAAASLIAMVVVSLLTPPPDEETQRMIDEVRLPKGKSILGSVH